MNEEFTTYGLHSDMVGITRKVRILQDVVVLLQEKNLLDEVANKKDYIKVGEIEQQLNWPLSLRQKYGSQENNDYFSKKLRTQIDEYNMIVSMIENDIAENHVIKTEMVEFITYVFGNRGWVNIVETRWLKLKKEHSLYSADPRDDGIVPARLQIRDPKAIVSIQRYLDNLPIGVQLD